MSAKKLAVNRKNRISGNNVIVAHPGTQHSYETALAMQQAGLLEKFVTGIYYKPNSAMGRGSALLKVTERELRRRYKAGIDTDRVFTHPTGEIVQIVIAHLPYFRSLGPRIIQWRNERFEKFVGQLVTSERPTALVCYDGCAFHAFRKAKEVKTLCILDQSIGHWQTLVELMREESELHPDFADSLPYRFPERWLAQRAEEAICADLVLVGSEYVKETMVGHGVDVSRIAIIPYGANTNRFRSLNKSETDKYRVLFVGQISQRKGIKYLLEAVKQLGWSSAELTLVGGVIGSGRGLIPYREYFRHVPSVPHHEIHQYFQEADVFIYPSLHEGSAIAIYEAMASGLPVITTANSGSVVRNGVDGFIVPIRDIEALKEKLSLLRNNHGLREEMGHNARQRAEEFTWNAYRHNVGTFLRDYLADSANMKGSSR